VEVEAAVLRVKIALELKVKLGWLRWQLRAHSWSWWWSRMSCNGSSGDGGSNWGGDSDRVALAGGIGLSHYDHRFCTEQKLPPTLHDAHLGHQLQVTTLTRPVLSRRLAGQRAMTRAPKYQSITHACSRYREVQ